MIWDNETRWQSREGCRPCRITPQRSAVVGQYAVVWRRRDGGGAMSTLRDTRGCILRSASSLWLVNHRGQCWQHGRSRTAWGHVAAGTMATLRVAIGSQYPRRNMSVHPLGVLGTRVAENMWREAHSMSKRYRDYKSRLQTTNRLQQYLHKKEERFGATNM